MNDEVARALGAVDGYLQAAHLHFARAWRIIAEGTAPGRRDLARQLARAESAIDAGDRAMGLAATEYERSLLNTSEQARAWQSYEVAQGQLRAVEDCLDRHREHGEPPLRCICPPGGEVADYCDADHTVDEPRGPNVVDMQAGEPACHGEVK